MQVRLQNKSSRSGRVSALVLSAGNAADELLLSDLYSGFFEDEPGLEIIVKRVNGPAKIYVTHPQEPVELEDDVILSVGDVEQTFTKSNPLLIHLLSLVSFLVIVSLLVQVGRLLWIKS
jgi:hypothetical protein